MKFRSKNFILRDFLKYELDVVCSIFLDIVNMVSRGVLERYVGGCNHGTRWGV